jgi:hypothetical protein
LFELDSNSDFLFPNEPQRKEVEKTISPCKYGLLHPVSSKQIQKKRNSSPSATSKRLFWDLVSQEESEAGYK